MSGLGHQHFGPNPNPNRNMSSLPKLNLRKSTITQSLYSITLLTPTVSQQDR